MPSIHESFACLLTCPGMTTMLSLKCRTAYCTATTTGHISTLAITYLPRYLTTMTSKQQDVSIASPTCNHELEMQP